MSDKIFNKKFFLHIALFVIVIIAIYFGEKWGHSALEHLEFVGFFLAGGISYCMMSLLKRR